MDKKILKADSIICKTLINNPEYKFNVNDVLVISEESGVLPSIVDKIIGSYYKKSRFFFESKRK